MFDKLKPLADRVLIKRIENEEKTAGGLYIPESAKEKAQMGTVVAVGNGRFGKDGNRVPLDVAAGQTVYFGKYAGTEAGDDHLIIREDEILGIVQL